MNKSMNLSGMTYNDLKSGYEALMVSINEQMKKCREYQQAMSIKRANDVNEALRILMDTYDLTKDEMKSYLDGDDSINPITTQDVDDYTEAVVIPEVVENPQIEDNAPLALPESSQEDAVETKDSINPDPKEEKNVVPKTPMVESDGELPTLDSLLSGEPEYKAFYHPITQVKKSSRTLPTMEELLSGEPINDILCLGNLNPKGAAFRQHSRINHTGGIIPTETATGNTLVYIPAA